MKTFEYTVKDELGIHARPAGLLVKEAKKFESECTITKGGKTKKLTQLMMLMSLGRKAGRYSYRKQQRVLMRIAAIAAVKGIF